MENQTYRSPVLDQTSGIQYSFGCASGIENSELMEMWDKKKPNYTQVHGIQVAEINLTQKTGQADAFFTTLKRQPIGVVTADCVPILLSHRSGSACLAIHAGWRGTLKGISIAALQFALEKCDTPASEWVGAIGPAICGNCYEVSQEIVEDFKLAYPDLIQNNHVNWLVGEKNLDLKQLNFELLKKFGVDKLDVSDHCTQCSKFNDTFQYHSYRRKKDGGRQISLICID